MSVMDSENKIKKVERKLKKLQHIVFKETGVHCDLTPTKNLVISNAGLINGLSEEVICKNFSKYGSIEKILLLPGKSCCFLSYTNETSANTAFENCNVNLPTTNSSKTWDELPPGLIILENFISDDEELKLLQLCNFQNSLNPMRNREVKHYGYEFRYDINNVDKDKPLEEAIPNECNFLWDRLFERHNIHFLPNQLTVNHYNPGQGIPQHVDTHSAFEDPIISLSLQSSVVMEFKKDNRHLHILLPRKSLAVISCESRYDWTHGITPRKSDVILSNNNFTTLERGVRVSFTFRKILQGDCNCHYKSKCDSYSRQAKESVIEDTVASNLEKLHVHEVYENIVTHFSETRHKPWPNVLEFVESFDTGSILIDIGCGNGKYLGQNKNIFDIGCDQSSGLINICRERNFEVFTSNCLSLLLKDSVADGVISIAVIHHLATEDRRLRAIEEMIRILKIGGKALIYVWAKDQYKDQKQSSYIKQDRKNRRDKRNSGTDSAANDKEVSIADGISLPVHTNRTQFKHSDLLVPWKLKSQSESDNLFLRFYHVFQEKELDNLCQRLNNVEVVKSYYDQGNWCVILKKVK